MSYFDINSFIEKIKSSINNCVNSCVNSNESVSELLKGREYYKPFRYPEFYERWKKHERGHWLPSEVPMHEDVNDWKNKLDQNQRDFLTNIFRFFTQGDVDVAGAYCTEYLPNFSQTPEIGMFMCSVAGREAVHIDAYSYLIETLGMPESTYKEFLQYHEMKEKQNYIKQFQKGSYGSLGDKKSFIFIMIILLALSNIWFGILKSIFFVFPFLCIVLTRLYRNKQTKIKEHIAAGIALFSGFTEGMQLFSSFTMLLSFPMNGLMRGMGQIVTWSIVDETQHTDGMISLFRIFVDENSKCSCSCKFKNILGCSCIRRDVLEQTVYNIAREMVNLEDAFIELAYEKYSSDEVFMNISKTTLKQYIRFIADKRLTTMRYKSIFGIKNNPLPEFEIMINAPIHTNFFENRSTDYAKTDNGDWGLIWGNEIKDHKKV
ncbi:ribonucleoside-diphosphate reductase subunit M2 [Dasineura jujubifolia toursvirus 2a]|nr:ribonucleoside-diphosphate reductase subunit M2 [Dasineura jujubifolia toursvirus 2a]